MNTLGMHDRFEPRDPSRRVKGLIVVMALHALVGYALVSGMAREGLSYIKKPLEAVVIQEVIIPPPPPLPKKIEKPQVIPKLKAPPPPAPFVPPPDVAPEVSLTAPVIESVATPPPQPVVIAPPPPAPAPVPVATGPTRTSIGLACRSQVPPEMPRRALRDGIEGVVKAQIRIKGGTIVDVTILSGHPVFHAAVKAAMMQYTCATDGGEIIATQEFNFRIE